MNRRRIVQMLRFVFVRIYENMQNCLKKIQSYHFNAHKNDRIHIAAYKYLKGISTRKKYRYLNKSPLEKVVKINFDRDIRRLHIPFAFSINLKEKKSRCR